MQTLEKISHSKWVQNLFPSCVWNFHSQGEKALYLTFDDGPVKDITPWVLNQLKAFNAKATFFCIGDNVRNNPVIFHQLLEQGHALGNHTQSHKNGWTTLYNDYLNDISKCSNLVSSNLFRPPYGKLKPLQLRTLKKKYKIIMWSYLTADYSKELDCDKVFDDMKSKIVSGDIIVFHDSLKAEKNLKILLPKVLHYFSEKGYRFKPIKIQD